MGRVQMRASPFVLAAALAASGSAWADPIYCPPPQRFSVVAPSAGESGVPTNASAWIREDPAVALERRPMLWDVARGAAVPSEELTTPIRGGVLVQLRPLSMLAPGHTYEVRASETLSFTTGDGADTTPPDQPSVEHTQAEGDLCLAMDTVRIDARALPENPMLLALEAGGVLLALDRGTQVRVPDAGGAGLSARVVAMDLAGNRSSASDTVEASSLGGCTCVTPPARAPGASWLASALAVLAGLVIVRKRRA